LEYICDYGCGQEAKYQFKNGKWCCSKNWRSCSEKRKKMSEEKNPMWNKHHSAESRKKQSSANSGENHPMWNKHHSAKTLKKLRTPFEKIIKFTEDEGCKLLSKETDYKNQFSELWFRCSKGHEFPMRWDSFKSGTRCPECFKERQKQRMLKGGAAYANSFVQNPSGPQKELYEKVKDLYPDAIMNYQVLNYSIDIIIPTLKIAIEYDGSYWHQDQEADDKRQKEIEDEDWVFLRYRDYVPSKKELEKDIHNL